MFSTPYRGLFGRIVVVTGQVTQRDYSLSGPENRRAVEQGLATAKWYISPIPRKRLKEMMQRKDGPAIRDTLIWFAALGLFGGLGVYFWGTWWAVPAFAVYGVLYGSAGDSRWHECSHGTAFKTRWMNEAVYQIGSFFVLREPVPWKWSHARHHTDTIIVGRDPEIAVPRPTNLFHVVLGFINVRHGSKELREILLHCFGRLVAEEEDYIPESEHYKVYRTARIYALIFATVIGLSIYFQSFLPLVLVGLPSFYGAWLHYLCGLTQHAGLAEDVLDHRLNCRTVYMNPIVQFIYWNMNYHVEHHMFPLVPYHALPALHEELKPDMPPAYQGFVETYREIIPTLVRQATDPQGYIRRPLPAAAAPRSAELTAASATA
jgi:fatty acid desaturase